MIGLDTNVVLRLLTGDDTGQLAAARALVEAAGDRPSSFYLNHVVLAECAWALKAGYRLDRGEISRCLRALAETPAFEIEGRDVVVAAIDLYETAPADFADCLIVAKNVLAGCSHTVTFDRDAQHLPGAGPV
ncbi:PIN domain-containing protein [Oleomonas cavernae]|uniref:PIN domain-containing protein n=1 Tax=Oleomonas cavernae TaxID=2320859 RepID=A0A418WFE0_9PROT|nr:type II toxin-antitoxin system VapC family toxin [Oleomonas cavernae]RJF88726.1 PIN domain-containing protein [Oleomonas cavernae]